MKTLEITGTARTATGKEETAKLRKTGVVPCIIYGNGENIMFSAPTAAFKDLIYTPNAYLVKINLDGRKVETGVMREVQYHPVTDEILHVDFYRVSESKPVAMAVPVTLTGSAEGVKLGGKLQQATRKIQVAALPKDLPDAVEVDITLLGLGKSIFVGDLKVENGNILTPKSTVICAVKMTRAAMGAAAAAATAKEAKDAKDAKKK
ncbi:MAG: 50S ribosomal protein L25/general stress protein Ctc [Prevotellaceae bacterium]|jgi:large subunit ribosomal protein L25|nr:50S ribosomal protein L25/general stress protein Ctc [Prevotellaceae bacterium]